MAAEESRSWRGRRSEEAILSAIEAVLNDAEQRQVEEESGRLWLHQLRDAWKM